MQNTFKCTLSLLLPLMLLLSGCANTSPEPIRVARASDAFMSCNSIRLETSSLLKQIGMSEKEISWKKVQNTTAWISGQLLLLPTLAMDVSGSSNIEAKAITMRMKRLNQISADKKC